MPTSTTAGSVNSCSASISKSSTPASNATTGAGGQEVVISNSGQRTEDGKEVGSDQWSVGRKSGQEKRAVHRKRGQEKRTEDRGRKEVGNDQWSVGRKK